MGETPSHDHNVLCNDEVSYPQEDVNRLVSDVHLRMSVSVLLDHPAEEVVLAVPSDEDLVNFVVSTVTVETAAEEDVADTVVLPSIREQLGTIAQAKLIIE